MRQAKVCRNELPTNQQRLCSPLLKHHPPLNQNQNQNQIVSKNTDYGLYSLLYINACFGSYFDFGFHPTSTHPPRSSRAIKQCNTNTVGLEPTATLSLQRISFPHVGKYIQYNNQPKHNKNKNKNNEDLGSPARRVALSTKSHNRGTKIMPRQPSFTLLPLPVTGLSKIIHFIGQKNQRQTRFFQIQIHYAKSGLYKLHLKHIMLVSSSHFFSLLNTT